jgi:hypothetical protein
VGFVCEIGVSVLGCMTECELDFESEDVTWSLETSFRIFEGQEKSQ